MYLKGKGFFLSRIKNCENGDSERIATLASNAGLSHLIIKIADGVSPSNMDVDTKKDLVPSLVGALRARNISVWGCHHIYGLQPEGEAGIAIERLMQCALDGYVVNAGVEYEQPGRSASASIFMTRLRQSLPDIPVALSSFKYPSLHRQFPWQSFLEKCDLIMPQVYWLKTHGNAGAQLSRSVQEFKGIFPHLPVCPTGPTFKEWGWSPYPEEILDFLNTAKSIGVQAVNFHSFDTVLQPLQQSLWQIIKNNPWQSQSLEKGIAEQYVNALNNRSLDQVLALYDENATFVSSRGILRGSRRFKRWYENLFERIVPSDKFTLLNSTSLLDSINFEWQARMANPKTSIVSREIIRLENEKISIHYSIYSSKLFDE